MCVLGLQNPKYASLLLSKVPEICAPAGLDHRRLCHRRYRGNTGETRKAKKQLLCEPAQATTEILAGLDDFSGLKRRDPFCPVANRVTCFDLAYPAGFPSYCVTSLAVFQRAGGPYCPKE